MPAPTTKDPSANPRGVYRRRRPLDTPLYQAVSENLETFLEAYEERFLERYGFLHDRTVDTFRAFLRCGILRYGFARIRCTDCRSEYLLAFSCQLRGVCPSCCQKRVEIWTAFLFEKVLLDVDHRQLVFVIPKRLRCFFQRDGTMYGVLCRAVKRAVMAFYRTGLGRPEATPGLICHIQLFGDRLNPHVHVHALCTDGAFDQEGFHHLPLGPEDLEYLQRLFQEEVFRELIRRGLITPAVREDMLSWRHTGFSIDGSVRVHRADKPGLARLLRYIGRPCLAIDRIMYDRATGKVTILSAKKRGGQRQAVAEYDPLTFLALLNLQVPPKGCHLVRYYGVYSSRTRAKRRQEEASVTLSLTTSSHDTPSARERRRRWAQLIRRVFEVDPLQCPSCGGQMVFVAFIVEEQGDVIERILTHLGEDIALPPPTGPPLWLQLRQMAAYYEAHPDVLPQDEADPPHPSDESYIIDEVYPDD